MFGQHFSDGHQTVFPLSRPWNHRMTVVHLIPSDLKLDCNLQCQLATNI